MKELNNFTTQETNDKENTLTGNDLHSNENSSYK